MASAAARRLFRPFLASDFQNGLISPKEHETLYRTALLFNLHPTRDLNIPPPSLTSNQTSPNEIGMVAMERERGRRFMLDMADRILKKRASEERKRTKELLNERKVAHRHAKAGPVLRAQDKLNRAQRLGISQSASNSADDEDEETPKKEKLPLRMLTNAERFEYEEARHKTIQELVNGMDEHIRVWREKRRQARLSQKQGQLPF